MKRYALALKRVRFAAACLLFAGMGAFAASADVRVSPSKITGDTIAFDIYINEGRAFAGVEIGIQVDGEKGAELVSFERSEATKSAMATPFISRRGTSYFGFYTGHNAYIGNVHIGTLTFKVSGDELPNVNVTEMNVVRVAAGGGGVVSEASDSADAPILVIALDQLAADNTHVKYISGYPDGTFRPDNIITRAEISAMLYALSADVTKATPAAGVFSDVANGAWNAQAINFCAKSGLFKGLYEGKNFLPGKPVTRGELVTMICRFKGVEPAKRAFADYPPVWEYIDAAYANRWIAGYPDGTFRPDRTVTRAEAVTVINKAMGRAAAQPPARPPLMSDVPKGHWAYLNIIEASTTHRFTVTEGGEERWAN